MATDALLELPIPSLINGISQQPSHQRLTSQAESQVNMLSRVADGVAVRPPMEHIKKLTGSIAGGAPTGGRKITKINRGDGQQFLVVLQDGDINVYDVLGNERVVNDNAAGSPGSYTYLDFDTSAFTAEQTFAVTTVADYTFILNRTKVPAMSGTPSAGRAHAHEMLLYITTFPGTAAGSSQTITIGTNSITTAGASGSTTSFMMSSVCTLLTGVSNPNDRTGTGGGDINDWKFTRINDNVLYGYQFQGTLHAVSYSDAWGDQLAKMIVSGTGGEAPSVARFSDLPAAGVDGFKVKVKGTNGNKDDDFWVVYSSTEKIWKETVEPGLYDSFNADTLPHALIYNEGTGQFSFETISWSSRLVGDATSAPTPSFIGNPISDILVHKNRLILLAEENVIASEAGRFFNFWPTTVTALVDSDVFDIAGTGNTVASWKYALPYLGNAVLFSPIGGVFAEVTGSRDEPLTIKNARVEERSYREHKDVRPVSIGSSILYMADRGAYSNVFMWNKEDVEIFVANDITAHVGEFLPTTIDRVFNSTAENIVGFLSAATGYANRIYVYRYHYLGNDQVMSSWSYWEIDTNATLLSADFINSVLYLLISRSDGIHLEKMDFGKTSEDALLTRRVCLDSLISVTGVYNGVGNTTSFTIPYNQVSNGGTFKVFMGGSWGGNKGIEVPVLSSVNGTITVSGNYAANPVFIGRVYTTTYELSQVHVRNAATASSSAKTRIAGRLQLKRGKVVFRNSAGFKVAIRSRESGDFNEYSDTFFPADTSIILDKGVFDFDIGGDSRNVRIILQGLPGLPTQFSTVDLEGLFFQHSVPL